MSYAYEPKPEFHNLSSVTLAELIDMGFFDWEKPLFDWSAAAYNADQYQRVCEQFVSRYYWREIGVVPPLQWAQQLTHKLRNEIMPKYRPLYEITAEGLNWLADSDEYGKERTIDSGFPETMLSGSEVYASSGSDKEYEHIRLGNMLQKYKDFVANYESIDKLVLDELECMFSGLWSSNVNGW